MAAIDSINARNFILFGVVYQISNDCNCKKDCERCEALSDSTRKKITRGIEPCELMAISYLTNPKS